ncbi:MAG: HypC/HybG/HupF family hydrogenase formation chaperone [Patescibacteria group bacterium]
MCLTLPARVKSAASGKIFIEVDLAGQARRVKTAFSEAVSIGDWVLVNADLAVAKITLQEAQEINDYLK